MNDLLKIYTVAFFGNRYIDNPYLVENMLENHIAGLIREKEYIDFLVGRNGEFDQCASSTVVRIQKSIIADNSSLVLVLPYLTSEYLNNKEYYHKYYSNVEVSYAASKAHPKSAIQIRNKEMVDRADLVICYVEKYNGGAYMTMKYALEQNKQVINLAEHLNSMN